MYHSIIKYDRLEVKLMEEKNKKKKKMNPVFYVIGSLTVAAVMTVVMPRVIDTGSDFISRKTQKPLRSTFDEDFEPEFVKRNKEIM